MLTSLPQHTLRSNVDTILASLAIDTPFMRALVTRALAYHANRWFRRSDGSIQIGDNASARKLRLAPTAYGVHVAQPHYRRTHDVVLAA